MLPKNIGCESVSIHVFPQNWHILIVMIPAKKCYIDKNLGVINLKLVAVAS